MKRYVEDIKQNEKNFTPDKYNPFDEPSLLNFMGKGGINAKKLKNFFYDKKRMDKYAVDMNIYDEYKNHSKDYIFIIEPIFYFNSMNNKYALTATKLVYFYEDLLAEDIKKGFNNTNGCAYHYNYNLYTPIHHMVPFSIYAKEKEYFGLLPFNKKITKKLNLNFDEIKNFAVGFGVVEFNGNNKEVEEKVIVDLDIPDFIYREGTSVYLNAKITTSGNSENFSIQLLQRPLLFPEEIRNILRPFQLVRNKNNE